MKDKFKMMLISNTIVNSLIIAAIAFIKNEDLASDFIFVFFLKVFSDIISISVVD